MSDIKKHTREHQMLLGPLERPALAWLAARMPAWVTPDVLTAAGVLGAVLIFLGYWLSGQSTWWLVAVNLGFAINWFGDSLDGTLARYRKIERPKFGFYIDHTVDAVAEFLTIIGIGMSPFMRLDIAAFALIGYLLMSVHVYVRTATDGVFKISYGTFGPTELRAIIMLVNVAIFSFPSFFTHAIARGLLPFDVIGIVLAVALGAVFLAASWKEAARLVREGN